ncbi:DUF7220 family protein [Albidovulum salinarum]
MPDRDAIPAVHRQSRVMSLVESITNVLVGYGFAVVTQILIFPVFGLHTTLAQNLKMGAVFTVVSIARSYLLRRLFEAIRIHEPKSLHDGMRVTRARPVKYTRFQREEPSACRTHRSTGTGSMAHGRKAN